MRKILALTLALMLVLSMSAVAFADSTIDNNNPTAEGTIKVTVNGFEGIVHAVTIQWTDMTFEYNFTGWNAAGLVYTGSWGDTSATITVTNHSNIAIKATATPEDLNSQDGIEVVLDSAATVELGIGDTGTFTLSPDGAPNNQIGNETDTLSVASVTISIVDIPRQ